METTAMLELLQREYKQANKPTTIVLKTIR